jgi:DNA-binding MarR family transcriptional regulator
VVADELGTGLLMFVAYRAAEQRAMQAVVEAGLTDLTTAQARVLQRVRAEGSRLTELAEAATVTKQTAGFLVDQLERAGYVERVPDPADGRAKLIRIAARGREAAAVADAAIAALEREWEQHLGARRWAQLRDALIRLREVCDPYA